MAEIGRNLSREADKVVRAWQETRAKGQALLQELANLGIGGGYVSEGAQAWPDNEQPLVAALDAVLKEKQQSAYESLCACRDQLASVAVSLQGLHQDLNIAKGKHEGVFVALNTDYIDELIGAVAEMFKEEIELDRKIIEEAMECQDRDRQLLLTSTWMMQPKVIEQKLKDLADALKLELAAE